MNNNAKTTYAVKRMRTLSWLCDQGFYPYATVPDRDNPKYKVWKYKNTPALENMINIYFNQLNNK